MVLKISWESTGEIVYALPQWALSPLILIHRLHLCTCWASVQSWPEDGHMEEHLRANPHLNNRYILQHQSNWLTPLSYTAISISSHYITTAKASSSLTRDWVCLSGAAAIWLFWADFPLVHRGIQRTTHWQDGAKNVGWLDGGKSKSGLQNPLTHIGVMAVRPCVRLVSYATRGSQVLFWLALWRPEFSRNEKKPCSCRDDLIPVSDNSQTANDGNQEGVPEHFENEG